MREERSTRTQVKYVLSRGPILSDDSLAFSIEAFPTSATHSRPCRLEIVRTALTQESRPKVLAWAAGFKAIEALSNARFLRSIPARDKTVVLPPLTASVGELDRAVSDAMKKSNAWLADHCPTCRAIASIQQTEFDLTGPSPLVERSLTLECPSGHSFDELLGNLLVLVKPRVTRIGSSSS
jgi:hypothetical protein